jgi:hypothetical protein
MKQVVIACSQYVQYLPPGMQLEFDWSSVIAADKWRKMKVC